MLIQDVMAQHRDDLAYHRLKLRLEAIQKELEDISSNELGHLKLRYAKRIVTIYEKLNKVVGDL